MEYLSDAKEQLFKRQKTAVLQTKKSELKLTSTEFKFKNKYIKQTKCRFYIKKSRHILKNKMHIIF